MYEPNQFLAMAAWHTLQNGSTTERTQTSLERERTGSRPAVERREALMKQVVRAGATGIAAGAASIARLLGGLNRRTRGPRQPAQFTAARSFS